MASRLPDVTFRIAGDGPRRTELKRRADSEDISNVEFHGRVDDVPAFLNSLDVYFQPSLFEGLCITVVEAMASGLPVVGSDVGGISETVVHGETGYLASPTDTDTFVTYLRRLLEETERRTSFGRAARERVSDRYSRDVLVSRFREALADTRLPLDDLQ